MYEINQRVSVVPYEQFPDSMKMGAYGRFCNKGGTVVDKLYSESEKKHYYKVLLDGAERPSAVHFTDDMLVEECYTDSRFEIIVADNVVIARMYDSKGKMIAEGHGHIFNGNTAARVAQATAFACKRLWESICPKAPARYPRPRFHNYQNKNTKKEKEI